MLFQLLSGTTPLYSNRVGLGGYSPGPSSFAVAEIERAFWIAMATGLLIHLWRLVAPEFDRVAWEHIVVHAEERLATLDPKPSGDGRPAASAADR